MLVCGSIYQACKFYELFSQPSLQGQGGDRHQLQAASRRHLQGGLGRGARTRHLRKYEIYRQMLADYFDEPADKAINKIERFEDEVKRKFVEEPGQMRLLIVVDKLLTGFDAPPATYLYIDKQMQDHGLFQAICRVNRLDGEDKELRLHHRLQGPVQVDRVRLRRLHRRGLGWLRRRGRRWSARGPTREGPRGPRGGSRAHPGSL